MGLQSVDELAPLMAECVTASFHNFRQDLELRIAAILRLRDVFPQNVVINIAQSLAREVGDMLEHQVFESGIVLDKLRKLL